MTLSCDRPKAAAAVPPNLKKSLLDKSITHLLFLLGIYERVRQMEIPSLSPLFGTSHNGDLKVPAQRHGMFFPSMLTPGKMFWKSWFRVPSRHVNKQ
jgi:hypothetical protein